MELSEEEFILFNPESKVQLLIKDGFLIHLFEKETEVVALYGLYRFIVEVKTKTGAELQIKTTSVKNFPDEYLEMIMIEELY